MMEPVGYTCYCPFCHAAIITREGRSTGQEVAENVNLFAVHVIEKHPERITGHGASGMRPGGEN